MIRTTSRLIGGILLVAGTTIGAAMLALPVSTGLAGFFPALALLVFLWFYMTYTAFLMLEVNLWMEKHTNLITMAKLTLGRFGEVIGWAAYLFLLYALTTAYVAGSGPIVIDFVHSLTGITLPAWCGSIPILLIFGFFVYKGTRSVDLLNRVLMLGLGMAYIIMVLALTPHVEQTRLMYSNPKYLLLAISLVVTSFGFHIIIPSLTSYFHHDVPHIKKAIIIGSIIPLFVYVIWEFLSLGIIPLEGTQGLQQGFIQGMNGATLLSEHLENPVIAMVARGFAFFAIVTSFLGVSLSLSDFLADGLHIQKTPRGRALLYILTFFPPILFTITYPRVFLTALEYAGAFGVVILLGILPALMVWRGRYYKHYQSTFKVPGGKLGLIIVILISISVIGIEVANNFGLFLTK